MKVPHLQPHHANWKKGVCILLIGMLLMPLLACAGFGQGDTPQEGLLINEVVSSNKRSLVDENVGSPDWVELYNPTDAAISLKGYGISDNLRNLHKYVFDDNSSIAPGAYLVIYCGDNSGVTKTDVPCTGFGLSKSGDYLFLTDNYYGLLQQVEIPALYTDVSYARREDGTFGYCATPTPGAPNTEPILASLDSLFTENAGASLLISEVMPTAQDGQYPWVELYNGGTSALQLENYYLSDSESNIMRWNMPAAAIPAGGYACIWLSGLNEHGENGIHAAFKLGSQDSCVLLTDMQGRVLDEMHWTPGLPSGISVLHGEEGDVYTAEPTYESANSENTFTSATLTPMDNSDPVHISEVLKENTHSGTDMDGDHTEWVELVNTSGEAVSLRGYYLSDNGDNLFKWALPEVSMEPGAYLIVYLSGKNRTNGELHASFGLSETETEVHLTCLDGMRTEHVSLAGITKDDVSVGRDASGNIRYYAYPTPGEKNAQGFETADSIGFFNKSGVFISEVCGVTEVKADKNDWIELHNGGSETVDLSGWYLSDSLKEPERYQIPALSIAPGAYAVIETTSHSSRQTEGVATFGIKNGGETLVLSDATGAIVDVFKTGALALGISSGRIENDDAVERVFFSRQTPGSANSSSVSIGYAPMPLLSDTSLYHDSPFSLTISVSDPEAVIRYTTDGSKPTASSRQYTEPLTIGESMTLRAASFLPNRLGSEISTATYLFVTPHTVPVVCICGDPDEVKRVMRVNDKDEKIEREAFVSYYEADGTLGTMFPAGIKPKGAGTVAYAQKSLSISLRAGYGQSAVTYPFFEDCPFTTFSALVVRNGGQDWSHARIRDSYCARLVRGMHLDYSATRPVAVYINASYNGLYDLNEDQNDAYLDTHYGIENDNVDFIRRNETPIDGTKDEIKRVRAYAAKTDLSDDAKFEEFKQWVDVEFFTDYFIAQTYFCNSDMFNQKYWRARDYSLKWRPVFFDLDFAYQSATRSIIGRYFDENGVPSADKSLTYFEIYIGLQKNASWRAYCAERYVEVVETYFNADRATAVLDELAGTMRPEMQRQIDRWGKPESMAEWEEELNTLRTIAQNRPGYALEFMRAYFKLSQSELDALIEKYRPTGQTDVATDPAALAAAEAELAENEDP